MDLDSKTYSKLINVHNSDGDSEAYISILGAICLLTKRHAYETPEM